MNATTPHETLRDVLQASFTGVRAVAGAVRVTGHEVGPLPPHLDVRYDVRSQHLVVAPHAALALVGGTNARDLGVTPEPASKASVSRVVRALLDGHLVAFRSDVTISPLPLAGCTPLWRAACVALAERGLPEFAAALGLERIALPAEPRDGAERELGRAGEAFAQSAAALFDVDARSLLRLIVTEGVARAPWTAVLAVAAGRSLAIGGTTEAGHALRRAFAPLGDGGDGHAAGVHGALAVREVLRQHAPPGRPGAGRDGLG